MRKHWKLTLAILIVLLTALVAWLSTIGDKPEKEVEAYKKSLIAKGEKLEISELLPPPVPPEQNGADIIREASSLLLPPSEEWSNEPDAMLMVVPGKAIVCFKQAYVPCYSFTNSWSNAMTAAKVERSASELLKQLLRYPDLDFHIDYNKGWDAHLSGPESRSLRFCAKHLSGDAICDLHIGDAASATTNICVLLALVNDEQDERLAYSYDLRTLLVLIAASTTWELLQSTNVNDTELALLQINWERLEFIYSIENTFLMDRAFDELEITKMRASPKYFSEDDWDFSGDWSDKMHDFWNSTRDTYGKAMWRASWTYSDELQMLQNYQLILNTVRTIETNRFYNPAYSNMMSQLDGFERGIESQKSNEFHWRISKESAGWGSFLGRAMASEAGRQIVISAIALKRYQLEHGAYPPDLNSLVPEFVSEIPMDPVDGKPLRYRLNGDGTFLLYSIGLNGRDDGGNPSLKAGAEISGLDWLNPDVLDMVWPQPATPAEIEYYYEHPPR